jgi:hypothetical protein
MSNLVMSQATSLAKSLSIDSTNAQELVTVLKATAFKGQVSDAQMAALLIVAQQYGLNPWTKEIYAFPDKNSLMAWTLNRTRKAALASFIARIVRTRFA